jgi:hypothetical protein
MRKGVHFNFKLDGATASHGSMLVYEALHNNSLFVLKASAASVSKASVAVDGPPSTTPSSVPATYEAYSNIRPAVDDKDILV